MITATRPLPGIVFDRVPAPVSRVLPRMDVAGFVGFAAAGPVDVPVLVTDVAGFTAVFGGPLLLGWDADQGRYAEAQLAGAVRAYFAGGGRRAHIVRLAAIDRGRGPVDGAERARHPVPGLLQAVGTALADAELCSRAVGSWSDTLSVGASLTSNPAVLALLERGADQTRLSLRGRTTILVGDLLRVHAAGGWTGYLPVRTVTAADGSMIEPPGQRVEVDASRALWIDAAGARQLGAETAWSALQPEDTVERLGLELWVRDESGQSWVLADLGFVPGHPRYLGDLPADEDYFTPREPLRGPVPGLWADVGRPRFPLAAAEADAVYYPVGVGVVPTDFATALVGDRPALERDGLGTFDADLFIDPGLREPGVETVLATADYLRWQASVPRRLTGVHALLDIDEVTVVATPDAVQRPWDLRPPAPPPQPPPADPPETPDPGCRRPPFADCQRPELAPTPRLTAERGPHGAVTLSWDPVPQATAYRLQLSTDSRSWDRTRDVYVGREVGYAFHGGTGEPRFYRVRAEAGTLHTAWSDGATVGSGGPGLFVVRPDSDPAGLLAVHRALLRMCAARGDLLAVLSLPEHYRAADAIAHATRLRTADDVSAPIPPLGFTERRALGFGALYHPWVGAVRDAATGVTWAPPDGAVTGIMARRALTRGAWVAPANERLTDVVALRRRESDLLLPSLQDAQVNALRQTPAGFVCLAEDTLTTDPEVRPINVRRLMSLIRRVAAREGAQYVFEPNDPTFRRAVERGFAELLAFLFRLGAFAGRTPEQAFRVEVGSPPNTPQSVDAGRLIVELKFAPAYPMEFVLVRLVQAGEHGFTLEEA